MALIKCNRCGCPVSDRVKVCPHCGAELHRENAAEVKSETPPIPAPTPNLTKCVHCGAMVSKKASHCPKCGQPLQVVPPTVPPPIPPVNAPTPNSSSAPRPAQGSHAAPVPPQPQSAVPSEEAYSYYSDEEENTSANVWLKTVVTILALIAFIFGCFLLKGSRYYNGKTVNYPIDSTFLDNAPVIDSASADTTSVDSCDDCVVDDSTVGADSASYDYSSYADPDPEPQEVGFTSSKDVWDYVRGESYSHNDVTLRISADGIYANGNKISTSAPKFYRTSPSRGKIVASPSISITVDRDYNRLIDNNSGDVYYDYDEPQA